jgi:hypothetical protein
LFVYLVVEVVWKKDFLDWWIREKKMLWMVVPSLLVSTFWSTRVLVEVFFFGRRRFLRSAEKFRVEAVWSRR